MATSPAWTLYREDGIRIGTASWTDKTLLEPGLFYPEGVNSPAERLTFYAQNFPIVEVDSTYYGLPAQRNAELWAERTPEQFIFNVKAFALLTQHPTKATALPKDVRENVPSDVLDKPRIYPRDLSADVIEECWTRFLTSLRPLSDESKLGALLFQFPEWFPPSRANREYVVECGDRIAAVLPGVACAVEFRSEGWMRDPERTSIPPVAAATAPLAVVRFHGRRSDTWGKRNVSVHDKFGYDYSPEELKEWQPRIVELSSQAREVYVLMNNCYRDYAVRSARNMAQMTLDLAKR
jgi:uncharacterized protein YecE (DUF72 family)